MKKLLLYVTMATIFSGTGSLLKAHPCPNPSGRYAQSCSNCNTDKDGVLTCQCWNGGPTNHCGGARNPCGKNISNTINLCGQKKCGKDVYLYNDKGTLKVDPTGKK